MCPEFMSYCEVSQEVLFFRGEWYKVIVASLLVYPNEPSTKPQLAISITILGSHLPALEKTGYFFYKIFIQGFKCAFKLPGKRTTCLPRWPDENSLAGTVINP